MINYIEAMYAALAKSGETENAEMAQTSQDTMTQAQLEMNIYNYWNVDCGDGYHEGKLAQDAAQVANWAKKGNTNETTAASTYYQEQAAVAQAQEQNQDGTVQLLSQRVTAEAQNLQNLTQLASSLSTISSTTAQILVAGI